MPKTILITGASTGFGHDTAETLSRAGHTVFASMREPQAKNCQHAETLRKQGIEVIELDVSSGVSVDRAVNEVLARASRIDVLVNNAGIARPGSPRYALRTRQRACSTPMSLDCCAPPARYCRPCADKQTG